MVDRIGDDFSCPECGAQVRLYNDDIPNYCPYCGAEFEHNVIIEDEELDYDMPNSTGISMESIAWINGTY